MNKIQMCLGALLVMITVVPPTTDAFAGAKNANAFTGQILAGQTKTHPSLGTPMVVEGAQACLLRTPQGFFADFSTNGLEPGHAYTLWLIAINAPQNCETTPCNGRDVVKNTKKVRAEVGYGDGMIAGSEGTARFSAFQPLGAFREAWSGFGLEQANAKVHFVLNDHGLLTPDREHDMLASYRGGCSHESIPEAFPGTARADGHADSNTCQLVQFVVFEPDANQ